MIIKTDMERPLTNPTQLPDKVFDTGGLEGTYLNTVKAINEALTANIILNGEKREALSPKSGT